MLSCLQLGGPDCTEEAKPNERTLPMAKRKPKPKTGANARALDELYSSALIFLDHLNDDGAYDAKEIVGPLNVAVLEAVKLYIETYQPRGLDKLTRHGWLAHGLMIKRARTGGTQRVSKSGQLRSNGENRYYCLFCRDDLATFGWNDGVHNLAPAAVDKLYTHTHWCAMQFIKRFVEGNDEGYVLAYRPGEDGAHRPRGTTARMLEGKIYEDRLTQEGIRIEQLKATMPLDESLKFDTFNEGRNS